MKAKVAILLITHTHTHIYIYTYMSMVMTWISLSYLKNVTIQTYVTLLFVPQSLVHQCVATTLGIYCLNKRYSKLVPGGHNNYHHSHVLKCTYSLIQLKLITQNIEHWTTSSLEFRFLFRKSSTDLNYNQYYYNGYSLKLIDWKIANACWRTNNNVWQCKFRVNTGSHHHWKVSKHFKCLVLIRFHWFFFFQQGNYNHLVLCNKFRLKTYIGWSGTRIQTSSMMGKSFNKFRKFLPKIRDRKNSIQFLHWLVFDYIHYLWNKFLCSNCKSLLLSGYISWMATPQ